MTGMTQHTCTRSSAPGPVPCLEASSRNCDRLYHVHSLLIMSLTSFPWWGFSMCNTAYKAWLNIITGLEDELKVHFLIGLLVFLVLSCMSCLYILEINPLSVVSFAIIFSHSEGCLFTLLIFSFAVQKLLSLIRPHCLLLLLFALL